MKADHIHQFTGKCFACNDEPNTRCECGECRHCGSNFEREVILEADRQRPLPILRTVRRRNIRAYR